MNTKKEDKKYVSATNISVMDNEFYIDSKVIKVKPLPIVFGCLGALVCPPVVVIPFISGNARRGTGNLGHMEVTK